MRRENIVFYICMHARARASVKCTHEKFLKKSCENIWSVKNKPLSLQQQNNLKT